MLRLQLAGLIAMGAMAVACAPESSPGEDESGVRQVSSAIINGSDSTDTQDFVLQLGLETDGAVRPQCSSSLVGKNLVLTARHCVGELDERTGVMGPSYDASRFTVYVGKNGPQKIQNGDEPDARGKTVITTGSSMFPDIALIVLDRDVDAPIAMLRLDDSPMKSEVVDVVGFGMDENNLNVQVRMQKDAVKVTALAPEVTQHHTLHTGEFAMGEAACYGDSGGPALSAKTNAIVGVASRVNSGVAGTEANPNAMCVGAEDVFTSLRPFRSLIDTAFTAAGAKPKLEPSSVKTGASMMANTDSDTQSTAFTNAAMISADDSTSGGCSSSGRSSTSGLGTALLGLGLVFASRRRKSS